MWRLDRQTDTRKAAISDISESTYAKVTYFHRLLIVVTPGKQHKSIHSSVQIVEVLTSVNRIRVPPPGSHIQTTQGQRVRSCLPVRGVI